MARFHDLARHRGNRPHDRVLVHPLHPRPAASATPSAATRYAAQRHPSGSNPRQIPRRNLKTAAFTRHANASVAVMEPADNALSPQAAPAASCLRGFSTRTTVSPSPYRAQWPASKNPHQSRHLRSVRTPEAFATPCPPPHVTAVHIKKPPRRGAGVWLWDQAAGQPTFLPLIGAQIRLLVRYSRTDRIVRNRTPTKPACLRAIILGSAAHIRKADTSCAM